jgi:hypothetical protein
MEERIEENQCIYAFRITKEQEISLSRKRDPKRETIFFSKYFSNGSDHIKESCSFINERM